MVYQKEKNPGNKNQNQKQTQNQTQNRAGQNQADINQQNRGNASTKSADNQKNSDSDFLSRWSRRKQAASAGQTKNLKHETQKQKKVKPIIEQDIEESATVVEDTKAQLPADVDMPAIESLTEDSDYRGFLSPKVSEALRKQALRKLFHSSGFNSCDGLDDYDGDYTEFAKLGDIVTADMKHQIEMEMRRRVQQLAEADPAEEIANTEVVTMTSTDNDSDSCDSSDTTETIAANAEINDMIKDDKDAEKDAEKNAEVKP